LAGRSSRTNVIPSERSRKKKRLFKGDKPFIRRFELEDMWILWAAYKEGSFPEMPEMDKELFYSVIRSRLSNYQCLYLVEDNNKKWKAGRGPICIIGANSDGWKYLPHVEYFKWATKYNIIRTTVCFLNWISFQKDVGICIIESLENTVNLFKYMKSFIGLNFVGTIPGGDPRGTVYVFSLLGKKDNGRGEASKRLHRDGKRDGSASASSTRSDGNTGAEVSSLG